MAGAAPEPAAAAAPAAPAAVPNPPSALSVPHVALAAAALVRRARPDLPGDARHRVVEPTEDEIAAGLRATGIPGEAEGWREAARTAHA